MRKVFLYMGTWFLALLLSIFELRCNAQVWPDSGCVDHPYTKGNDGRIYHSNLKCKVDSIVVKEDSMFCFMCFRFRTVSHVMARIKTGFINMAVNSVGFHDPTPLGLWCLFNDVHCLGVYGDATIPNDFLKYLPEDFIDNKQKYYTLLIDTDQ